VLFSGSFHALKSNREFQFYLTVIVTAIVATVVLLTFEGLADREMAARSFRSTPPGERAMSEKLAVEGEKVSGLYDTIRHAAFQVISLTTTTGFTTADFDLWPNALRVMLVVLMFFGGCAGSTGGGIKMVRIMVVLKTAWREVRTMVQPRLIAPVKIAGRALEEKQVANIVGFFVLFIVLFVAFTFVMSLILADFTTALTAVVATICNIGPGLGGIGATENYAWIPQGGKWILTVCMLLGRLEVYTVIIAFAPISWRR
jgi:trk system potassium uptake protein TrkH